MALSEEERVQLLQGAASEVQGDAAQHSDHRPRGGGRRPTYITSERGEAQEEGDGPHRRHSWSDDGIFCGALARAHGRQGPKWGGNRAKPETADPGDCAGRTKGRDSSALGFPPKRP